MPADPQRSKPYGRFARDRRRGAGSAGLRISKRLVRYAQSGTKAIDGTTDANNAATLALGAVWPATASTVSGTINTTWSTWTATGSATVIVPAAIATSWGTWTATAAATVTHPATIGTAWSTWTATATAVVQHPATIATTWTGWSATSSATVEHSATISTTWSTWTATAVGTVESVAPPPSTGGGRPRYPRPKARPAPYLDPLGVAPPNIIDAYSLTLWATWTATATAQTIDDGQVLELVLLGAL